MMVLILILSWIVPLTHRSPASRGEFGRNTVGMFSEGLIRGFLFLRILQIDDSSLRKAGPIPSPAILACNHPALWDAILILRRFPATSCIMKADLQNHIFLGNLIRFAAILPNAPRLLMVRETLARLQAGGRVLLFPEGTRTREENTAVNPFRPGFAILAKKADAPIIPIFIRTDSPFLEKGWPIWRMPQLPVRVSLMLGEAQKPEPGESARDFSARMEALFNEELTADSRDCQRF